MKKLLVAALIVLPLFSHARGELTSSAVANLEGNADRLPSETIEELLTYEDSLQNMSRADLVDEVRWRRVTSMVSCTPGHVAIVVSGAAESLPAVNLAVKGIAALVTEENATVTMTSVSSLSERIVSGALGGIAPAVAVVGLETLATADQKKIEARIHAMYPGTQVISSRLLGETSVCGKKLIKLEMASLMLKSKE